MYIHIYVISTYIHCKMTLDQPLTLHLIRTQGGALPRQQCGQHRHDMSQSDQHQSGHRGVLGALESDLAGWIVDSVEAMVKRIICVYNLYTCVQNTCLYKFIHICVYHVCMHIHACILYMYIYIYICVFIYTYIYIYIYTYVLTCGGKVVSQYSHGVSVFEKWNRESSTLKNKH